MRLFESGRLSKAAPNKYGSLEIFGALGINNFSAERIATHRFNSGVSCKKKQEDWPLVGRPGLYGIEKNFHQKNNPKVLDTF